MAWVAIETEYRTRLAREGTRHESTNGRISRDLYGLPPVVPSAQPEWRPNRAFGSPWPLAPASNLPGPSPNLQGPARLHVLSTMNSAERSIAILYLEVRWSFAFVGLWPQLRTVEEVAGARRQQATHDLLTNILEHAADDAFSLLPGHSCSLARDDEAAPHLSTSVVPPLRECFTLGYVTCVGNKVRDRLDSFAAATTVVSRGQSGLGGRWTHSSVRCALGGSVYHARVKRLVWRGAIGTAFEGWLGRVLLRAVGVKPGGLKVRGSVVR